MDFTNPDSWAAYGAPCPPGASWVAIGWLWNAARASRRWHRIRPRASSARLVPTASEQRRWGAGESRLAAQLVAGRGCTPRVVGAKGVARPGPPDPRSQAECAEDDRDEAPRAIAAPRRVNARAAATCVIGQLGTVLTEP